ncbi:hypothetical protein V9L05_15075 [Bernardetia sp. Wsw4-3y2]|uniref:hypothetical protein n=1 Tax=Bernardetia sp. Wsw4-3y2 TaxID=3127471 RepID=UPI0030D3BC59
MKKEYLTLQDRKEMRAKSKDMGAMYLTVFILGFIGWGIYQYYADEKYTTGSIFYLVISSLIMFIAWVIHSLEEWQHYKWVMEGIIQEKDEYKDMENKYLYFKVNERAIIVSKEDFDTYKVGQKVKVEQTAITKSTIRITVI